MIKSEGVEPPRRPVRVIRNGKEKRGELMGQRATRQTVGQSGRQGQERAKGRRNGPDGLHTGRGASRYVCGTEQVQSKAGGGEMST